MRGPTFYSKNTLASSRDSSASLTHKRRVDLGLSARNVEYSSHLHGHGEGIENGRRHVDRPLSHHIHESRGEALTQHQQNQMRLTEEKNSRAERPALQQIHGKIQYFKRIQRANPGLG